MKNQALVTAVSGLLIGGFGIANKVDILKIAGTGLLISSATVTLTSKQNQTKSAPIVITPEAPKQPETVTEKSIPENKSTQQSITEDKSIQKPILKNKPIPKNKSTQKPIPKNKPIQKPIAKNKPIQKPILQVK